MRVAEAPVSGQRRRKVDAMHQDMRSTARLAENIVIVPAGVPNKAMAILPNSKRFLEATQAGYLV